MKGIHPVKVLIQQLRHSIDDTTVGIEQKSDVTKRVNAELELCEIIYVIQTVQLFIQIAGILCFHMANVVMK